MQPEIPLSLYIHFPWCVKKCPYCDFNSHPARGELPERDYVDALIQDFTQQLSKLEGRIVETVFIGGGTPSLISPTEIKRLMKALFASRQLRPNAEITLEANPGALDVSNFGTYLQAGINRLSIGVQSFKDVSLQKIGRIHSGQEASLAAQQAKQAGFERINLDLMFGLPEQQLKDAREDIEQALSLEVDHLSIYQLTIESNTHFALSPPNLPDSDLSWAMQEQAQDLLSRAGFEQYEVSAYSRQSPCQHNLNYWQFGDYLAIGAGAHGKLSAQIIEGKLQINRYWNHRHPKRYLQATEDADFEAQNKIIAAQEIDFEYLMNALRLKAGFDLAQYQQRSGRDVAQLLQQLAPFIDKGWLLNKGAKVRPTEEGYRYLDSMLLACLP